MPGLDNKLSNIIGTKLPTWVLKQLETRSNKNNQESRDNDNILYLANKSAWVRLVSSIDIDSVDLNYFKNTIGANLTILGYADKETPIFNPTSLAKQYVLFGGTSKYLDQNSYQLRSGLGKDNSYGILGDKEIQDFGYKPMPGITSVTIDTQGRLGSVRAATINFKCWDKYQLDIIDALYFKLGFTMFLEWGHTYFYPSAGNSSRRDPNKILSTELYAIDPFEKGLNKEDIQIKIAQNCRNSEGNYDAMLGIVTNFNFTYTQDGGYDCTLKLMALGVLGDSIRINNAGTLPNLLEEEINKLNNTLIQISNPTTSTSDVVDSSKLKTIEQVLADASQNKIIKGTVLKVYPSSPEKLVITTKTVKGKDKNTGKDVTITETKTEQVPTGEFTKPDTIIFYTDTNEKYYIVTRIGQVVKYDQNFQYIGLIDTYQLNTFRSNKKGDFLSNLLLSTNDNPNIEFNKLYAIGSVRGPLATQFRIEYTSQTKDNSGKIGELKKYIKVEFTLVDFKVPEGKDLVRDAILPAIKKALEKSLEEGDLLVSINDNNGKPEIKFEGTYQVSGVRTTPKNISQQQKANQEKVEEVFLGAREASDVNTQIDSTQEIQSITKEGKFKIFTDDSFLIKDILVEGTNNLVERQEYLKNLNSQNKKEVEEKEEQKPDQEAISTQIKQALNYQSTLEIMLRTIQLHALNKAINQTSKPDLEIGRTTYVLDIADPNDKAGGTPFLQQIFSTGVFSKFIQDLVTDPNNKLRDSLYTVDKKMDPYERFQIQSKYGFATSLMGNKEPIESIQSVDFKELLKAYVVPYQINQEIIKGTYTNHPVYIPLGLLLMILNHSCTIYDTKEDMDFQTPLVYVDFNPEMNFCLTNTKHLSTNPWVCLIPFEGSDDDYRKLFNPEILIDGGTAIAPTSGSEQKVPLFKPDSQDYLSGTLPTLKFDKKPAQVVQSPGIFSGLASLINDIVSSSPYRGKIMNILLNIDYLVDTVQQYSYKDGTNSVYLKSFIEQILVDVNKSLGNFNAFRLSYNDSANTFQIVDDQFIPALSNEEQVTPKPKDNLIENTTELPLLGKFSIAKNLEIKSEVSSKLSNMLAISANANSENKATLSTNGDPFGFVNTAYTDRYISNRMEVTGSGQRITNNDTIKISAQQFNSAISDFYSKINPSQTSVSHATNYYMDKMTKIKNEEYATRAAAMIPVSLNFTTDGISGLSMYQAFTVPDKLLPYTYTTRKIPGAPQDHLKNMGFVVVGLTHTIENNQWNTAVRANMTYLKDKTEFSGSVIKVDSRTGTFEINTLNEINTAYAALEKSPPVGREEAIKITKTFFEQKGYSPIQVSAIVGALLQESELNPNAINKSSKAYGIAQWLGDRKDILLTKPDYEKLETQLAFVYEELIGTNRTAGNNLKAAKSLEDAIAAMAGYERYKGIRGQSPTYDDVLRAPETGNRIGYSKYIYNNYYS